MTTFIAKSGKRSAPGWTVLALAGVLAAPVSQGGCHLPGELLDPSATKAPAGYHPPSPAPGPVVDRPHPAVQGTDPALGWYIHEFDAMSTRVSLYLRAASSGQAEGWFRLTETEFERIEADMSSYRSDSLVSLLNRDGHPGPVFLTEELWWLLSRAAEVSEWSAGAFDVSFGAAGQLYDYRKAIRPAPPTLTDAVKRINWRELRLAEQPYRAWFGQPGMRVDLGGIAKGYSVERVACLLEKAGLEAGRIAAGGDLKVIGQHDGRAWQVGIRHPRSNPDKPESALQLPLTDTAISTSGDYERYFMVGDLRVHHILQPATGRPAGAVQSVSVIGPDATLTDALSTALFVAGPEAGLDIIEQQDGYEAIMLDHQQQVHFSSGLSPNSAPAAPVGAESVPQRAHDGPHTKVPLQRPR